jgi:uncharacterized protein (DUF362 family)
MLVINYKKDIVESTLEALQASDIDTYLKPHFKVAVKPNLVVARPASDGATTHPQVVEGIVRYLRAFGIRDITVIESSWIGDCTQRAYKNCGYEYLTRQYGVALVDLKDDTCTTLSHGGLHLQVCDQALATDFLINVPVLKAHCQTRMTCCMKNLKGCIPDSEKSRFHSLGLHKPIAVLNALVKTGYCVVDGICGDLDFEEGGSPVQSDRIIVGQSPVLVDAFCAALMGYAPEEIGYLAEAARMGLGPFYDTTVKLVELNAADKPTHQARGSRLADRYKGAIHEDAACSVCYSTLVRALHRLGTGPSGRICIGQGFKDKSGTAIGVGDCTAGLSHCIAGCPPKAVDIIKALK